MTTKFPRPDKEMFASGFRFATLAMLRKDRYLPPLLTSREITGIFRLSAKDLCRLRESGRLPAKRIRRSFRYNMVDVLELLLYKHPD